MCLFCISIDMVLYLYMYRAMHNGQLSEDSQFAAAKKLGEVEK